MGTTGNDSGLNYLDATFEDEAAKIQMALEACSCKFSIVKTNSTSPSMDLVGSGLAIDDEQITYDIIRFIIEPGDNAIRQGFEIAQTLGDIEAMLHEADKRKNPDSDLEFRSIAEAGEEMQERFNELRTKFANGLG